MEPVFLELGGVLLIHRDQVERYGGSTGIRDVGLLQSATSMPRAGVSDRYLHEGIFEMAVGEDDLEAIVRSVAEGNTGKADIAVFFREATGP